jgi:hypothetical protein
VKRPFLGRAVVVFSGNERSEETLGVLRAGIFRVVDLAGGGGRDPCPWRVWRRLRSVPLEGAVELEGGALDG